MLRSARLFYNMNFGRILITKLVSATTYLVKPDGNTRSTRIFTIIIYDYFILTDSRNPKKDKNYLTCNYYVLYKLYF